MQPEKRKIKDMCTYSVSIDDAVMELAKPHFKGADAMKLWIEQQLQKVLVDYINQFKDASHERAEGDTIMAKLKAIEGDPDGFFKIAGILGRPRTGFSWEQLREEAANDRYGI